MTKMRWWSVIRMVTMGIALALVVAASADECDGGGGDSSEVDCPGVGEMLSITTVAYRLPQSELAGDLEYAKEVAERVASAEDVTCTRADNGLGYNVAVPYTKARDIHVRVMARSRARRNYYRVAVDGLGAVDRNGRISHRAAATHHQLSGFSFSDVNDILDIIDKIKERKR